MGGLWGILGELGHLPLPPPACLLYGSPSCLGNFPRHYVMLWGWSLHLTLCHVLLRGKHLLQPSPLLPVLPRQLVKESKCCGHTLHLDPHLMSYYWT
ncbi:hypothetical protein DPEC_G00176960 [Dallia pectoralis]|uniref:Uncharacterized protein n=1 Tax=Dallia pectoralis TaxID=75939 RepID=A0ACC2GEU4_DALPE|nr:hypothetical protein DPEC_G00176960 [Dallia pectoralis]